MIPRKTEENIKNMTLINEEKAPFQVYFFKKVNLEVKRFLKPT